MAGCKIRRCEVQSPKRCGGFTDFYSVLFNPVAQAKFVHTVGAGYVAASVFVMGVSAWYLLRGKWTNIARRSMMVASAFGLASSLSVVVLGDKSGYALTDNQRMKLAAIEAMWHTEPAPLLASRCSAFPTWTPRKRIMS